MKRYLVLVVIGLIAGLAVIGGWTLARPYTLHGGVIEPAQAAPDFSLADFHLAARQGKVVVLFFGYTNCTDVCPATLAKMKELLKRLGADAGSVQMVFVTVDPQHDTAEKMKSYTAGYDSRILGLTGSPDALKAVWQQYGVTVQQGSDGSVDDTAFEHSARIYVIDRQGNLHVTYTSDTSADDLLADLKYLIKL